MERIPVRIPVMPVLEAMLHRHPGFALAGHTDDHSIRVVHGGRERVLWTGRPEAEVAGLVELMDNNPIVCCDEMSVPDAASTLAVVAVGPLLLSGILAEPPSLIFSFEPILDELEGFLSRAGLEGSATVGVSRVPMGSALACTAMAVLRTDSEAEFVGLYRESFGRTFYIREGVEPWEPAAVQERPFAAYRLQLSPNDGTALATIQVMADAHGKCGDAQLVHALNLMCGYEETLGID